MNESEPNKIPTVTRGLLGSLSSLVSCLLLPDFSGILLLITSPSANELKMFLVESKGGAIACMLFSLLFLGTWPAFLTLLERRGRLPQHTYLDYSITNLLAAVFIALTFGEVGKSTFERPNFTFQLTQLKDNWPTVLFAMVGGVFLSLGNLATQYAWAFVGLSVTEVITSSITVVIGTSFNYFLDDKINKAEILFPGVACFLIAVCLGSAVHSSNAADNKAKLKSLQSDDKPRIEVTNTSTSTETFTENGTKDLENGNDTAARAKAGTAHFLVEIENRRAIKVFGKSTLIGLAITFFAGCCFSLFSPAFNLASNDQWHTLKKGVPNLRLGTHGWPSLWVWKRSPIYGRSSCRICSCRRRSGSSACEYILGSTSVRGVPEVIKKNIHIAIQYVAHVYSSSCNPHGIVRTSEMSTPAKILGGCYTCTM
ncbi:hypothetical protein QYF36_009591 [Acer negundo]|nr:hypothetical protein QYF36_009591 [Acer negundo]